MSRIHRRLPLVCLLAPAFFAGCGGGSDGPVVGRYTVGGSVSGLSGSGLILSSGSERATLASGSTQFTMPVQFSSGTAYAIAVYQQPATQTCSVASGSGTVAQANIANVVVTCADNAHGVSGSVSGLTAAGLVIANGADTVAVDSGATTFSLLGPVAQGSNYAVTVQSQPTGENCAVTSGSGTMGTSDVTSVAVTCSAQSHSVGGTVSGLGASGLVLANGSDTVTVASGATGFTLLGGVNYGANYNVTVQTQPVGSTCSVTSGSGAMGASDVADVSVTCSVNTHNISGTVSGLSASGLVLSNGSDVRTVLSGATSFGMPTPVPETAHYGIAVQTQPAGLTCSVSNGSGTMGGADVSNVAVTCAANAYTLGGTISGLNLAGLVLANGSDTLSVATNASVFTMPASVAFGAAYNVTAHSLPPFEHCDVTNGSTTMLAADVTNVNVACYPFATVATIAGTPGVSGSTDATGPAASFSHPFGVVVDSAGNYFVGDLINNEVRKVTPAGVVTTFAGTTTHSTADGTGAAAGFYAPSGLAIDASDNLYVVDRLNYTIRKITPAGVVTTLAGQAGSPGSANGTGSAASFSSSFYGLAVDSQGNVYVADMSNNEIRKITPAGVVTTFAGSTTPGSADGAALSASFSAPAGIAIGPNDDVYVSEVGNHRIRKITQAGVVSTIAGAGTPGNNDGTGSAAKFNQPYGLTVDANGMIYVADTLGNKIRRVTPSGVVTTLMGSATSGHADGTNATATLYLPTTVTFDRNGNLIFADYNNNTIRKITP